jgi:raffinose/stachyose/melibiose transport system permease protein
MAGTAPTTPTPSITQRVRGYLFASFRVLVMFSVAAAIITPMAYAALGGLRTTGELLNRPFALPTDWWPHNYIEVLQSETFWTELFNSVAIAAIATFTAVALAALAAFAFARIRFPGREGIYTLFVLGLLFPAAVAILPLFILIRQLTLLNSWWGVALPQAAFALPITVVILRPFFRAIPFELEDAARIDGCSTFGFFWRVALPLSRPALATVAVLAIVGSWNAFLLPLLVLRTANQWTLPLGVMNFSDRYTADTALVLAFTTLSLVPALIFYVIAERQIVGGLTAGAVKG